MLLREKRTVGEEINLDQRLNLLQRLLCAGLLAGILLSFRLWTADRFFPLMPVWDALPGMANTLHNGFLGVLLLTVGANMLMPKRGLTVALLAELVLLLLLDQNRWQPWVYIYGLFLLGYAFKPNKPNELLCYFQLIMVGVYAWSGIHKLNGSFIDTVFFEILTGVFRLEDRSLIETIKPLGFLIPLVEVSIAIGLFIPSTRKFAVYAAVAMHLFILFYLSPLGIGANTVVYPWNVAMICMVVVLFYQVPSAVVYRSRSSAAALPLVAVGLVWLMPLLNFWGLWDHYLSFSLYSGKTNAYYIVVGEKELYKLDERYTAYFLKIEGMQGGQIIHVNKWAQEELNVPFYPESRMLKQLSQSFCELGIESGQLYFLEFELPIEKQRFSRFTCEDIKP